MDIDSGTQCELIKEYTVNELRFPLSSASTKGISYDTNVDHIRVPFSVTAMN